jgi:hypothetical protein
MLKGFLTVEQLREPSCIEHDKFGVQKVGKFSFVLRPGPSESASYARLGTNRRTTEVGNLKFAVGRSRF